MLASGRSQRLMRLAHICVLSSCAAMAGLYIPGSIAIRLLGVGVGHIPEFQRMQCEWR